MKKHPALKPKTNAGKKRSTKANMPGKHSRSPMKKLNTKSRAAGARKAKQGGKPAVHALKDVQAAKAGRKAAEKTKKNKSNIPSQKEAKEAINAIMGSDFAIDYLQKNVSKNAADVLGFLGTPKTDEYIAEQLAIKINSVRRILNIMQGYGITNYYIAKNTNGWLSFAWYINVNKIQSFFNYIRSINGNDVVIRDDCNDYFICGKCYKDDRLIFTFEAAFEAKFRCSICGSKFDMVGKDEAERLVYGKGTDTSSVQHTAAARMAAARHV